MEVGSRQRWRLPRYSLLLLSLLVFIGVAPLLPRSVPPYFIEVGFNAIIIAGLLPALRLTQYQLLLAFLTAGTIMVRWFGYADLGGLIVDRMASIVTIIWFFCLSSIVFFEILAHRRMKLESIFGSLIVYFYIIFIFSEIYTIFFDLDKSNFDGLIVGREVLSLIFFSMSSMAGTEIALYKVNNHAIIAISIMQTIIGLFYTSVIIAWMVGLNWSQQSEQTRHNVDGRG